MHTSATIGPERTASASRWLGVAVALWLNLAVQPCAMALGVDDECPHCPPAHDHEMAAHHGHHDIEIKAGCDSPLSDCADSDDFSIDGRSSQAKLKDKSDAPIIIAPASQEEALGPVYYSTTAADPPRRVAASPPIHLLNCVFLD